MEDTRLIVDDDDVETPIESPHSTIAMTPKESDPGYTATSNTLNNDHDGDTMDVDTPNKKFSRLTQRHQSNEDTNAVNDATLESTSLNDPNSDGEHDPLGEQKVDLDGVLQGGREYAVLTFPVKTRHPRRLYMLAKEPSALLHYRDSYVFFVRNPDLKRVDADDQDREFMNDHGYLPSTLRRRNILLVSARSVFKKFGHLVIKNGRPWKDDYFEARMPPPTPAELAALRAARNAPQWDPSTVVPRLALKPPRLREKDIPAKERLYHAAQRVRELNAKFAQRRAQFASWSDPHTQIQFIPTITQPTQCRLESILPISTGMTSGKETGLINDAAVEERVAFSSMDTDTIDTSISATSQHQHDDYSYANLVTRMNSYGLTPFDTSAIDEKDNSYFPIALLDGQYQNLLPVHRTRFNQPSPKPAPPLALPEPTFTIASLPDELRSGANGLPLSSSASSALSNTASGSTGGTHHTANLPAYLTPKRGRGRGRPRGRPPRIDTQSAHRTSNPLNTVSGHESYRALTSPQSAYGQTPIRPFSAGERTKFLLEEKGKITPGLLTNGTGVTPMTNEEDVGQRPNAITLKLRHGNATSVAPVSNRQLMARMEASTTDQLQKDTTSTTNHELSSRTELAGNVDVKETRMMIDEEVDVVNGHDDIAISDSHKETSSIKTSTSKRKPSISYKHEPSDNRTIVHTPMQDNKQSHTGIAASISSQLPEEEPNDSMTRERQKRKIYPRLPFGADSVETSRSEYPQKRNRLERSGSVSSDASSVASSGTSSTIKSGKVTLRLKPISGSTSAGNTTNGYSESSAASTPSTQRTKSQGSTGGTPVPSIKQILVCFHCLKTTAPSTLLGGKSEDMLPASRKAFVTCTECKRKYHTLCANLTTPRVVMQASEYPWRCRNCKRCTVCDKEVNDKERDKQSKHSWQLCAGCDRAWHNSCCANTNQGKKKKKGNDWHCPACTRCHTCHTKHPERPLYTLDELRDVILPPDTSTPNQLHPRYVATYCHSCYDDYMADRYCPCCLITYKDENDALTLEEQMELEEDTGNMACCDICERWIHMRCDNQLSEERLEELEQENQSYACPLCDNRLEATLRTSTLQHQREKRVATLEVTANEASHSSRLIIVPEMKTAHARLLTPNGDVA